METTLKKRRRKKANDLEFSMGSNNRKFTRGRAREKNKKTKISGGSLGESLKLRL